MKKKKKSTRRLWIVRLFKLALAGAALLALFIFLVWAGAFGRLPNDEDILSIRNYLASEVYSSDNTLIGKYFVQNRTGANIDEIPQTLIDALVATEDARFFEHNGVDKRSLARVIFKTLILQDASSGGGSTLTQQLVKNTYGRDDFGFLSMPVAKVKEIIIAQRFEETFNKEQILELYLNTVSFGENVYGIETASQRYFNKKPASLSIEECAVLVGLLKGNTLYNPRRNPELALDRRNTVLDQMAKYEYITEAAADSIQAIPMELNYYNLESDNPAPYFIAHIEPQIKAILDELRKPDGSEYDLRTDGLIIETTLNSRLQQYAVASVERHMKSLQGEFNAHWGHNNPWGNNHSVIQSQVVKTGIYKRLKANGKSDEEIIEAMSIPHPMTVVDLSGEHGVKNVEMSSLDSIGYYQSMLHTGFLAMEPNSGNVLAWVGGLDYTYLPYDHVTTRRQTASTFKPFVYGAAIESGIDECTYFRNVSQTYPDYDNWHPTNSGGDDSLYYNLRGALKKSLNVISVEVLLRTGMGKVENFAKRAGFSSPIRRVPSMALGTNEATLLEMVNSYCTFANHGKRVRPRYITKITDAFGTVIYKAPGASSSDAIENAVCDELTSYLQAVINEGTARSARSTYGLSSEYAGKTGTAQDYADGWFIGYSPKLVAGAWVGASNPKVHFRNGALGAGSHMALPIWARFFRSIEGSGYRSKYTGSFELNPLSDSLDVRDCPDIREADFLERLGNYFDDGERKVDTNDTGDRSFWDRLFGR
ncbi:MAG: hypothetical protein EP346_11535 [Bacteroidetes bacterium]|uniref:Uncharacterized protein n=1 Tax=Phaeocystidibacter marisrubri TaxID=1577780 RepID=A0A6L3ZII3_9FLAO|nr:transglycosylase domain-containing protein [Phaeocystidibacter marisrubri]KAB2817285.1 hypothetical protein F8C82_02520 [Phaeocystidibacter marisrubri]TNE27745.1 MAG: hypothetical protein EP346_11535 [Bacteroidota bacterium]GGH76100.1 penicillin-binding protein 1A [Phaeocystidibacter marisrubri]